MADASVVILLNSLEELQVEQPHRCLLENSKDRVEKLQNYLPLFKTFLKDAPRQRREDEMLWKLIRSIRDAVYEAEDIIDANKAKRKNYLFHDPFKIINRSPNPAKSLLEKIAEIYRDTRIHYVAGIEDQNGWTKHIKGPKVGETNVVGFEDEVQRVKGFLSEESQELEAISIVGMPGLGKTTLVGKIFHDPDIRYEFPTRIWVHVSQEFTEKDIFLAILNEVTTITNDVKSRTEKELANLVMSYLENRRFLLVMDEVWSSEDWDKLKVALPSTNKRGKILITSRWVELGWHVNRRRGPHMLRLLTAEESVLLLQLEVSRELNITGEWKVEGRQIAEKCGGLALAIVVIGGILVNIAKLQYPNYYKVNFEKLKPKWKDVSDRFDTHFIYEDHEKHLDNIILLNYAKLPNHLRECFLYFGMFPENIEMIPAWQLICLWIAEGFIQEEDGVGLEETAENYLKELINRNLVTAEYFHANGKVKTCRIHSMLRDFCLNEAGVEREGFLQEIKESRHVRSFVNYEELTFHRLSIRSSALKEFVSSKPFAPIVRSFVNFSTYKKYLSEADFSAIPKGFKQLRILHVERIQLTELPRGLCQLSHLRYLVLTVGYLTVLPSAFSKLWNIQTLVVRTHYFGTVDIKADILNMSRLRHFKTYAAAVLPKASESSKRACEQIQTLGNIAPESCTEDVFDRARNLKKLGVCGDLSLLLDEKSGSFESLAKLSNLENLKLLNHEWFLPSEVRFCLPPAYKFPPKLKSLTLSKTYLDWRHMSIIGSLDKLEILKLKHNAFYGEIWEATDGGFRHLEVLHIKSANLKIWSASHHHFPRLKHLQLDRCRDLEQVPIELAHVPSFLTLELYCSNRCAASAKKIEAKIKKNDQYSRTAVRQFRLSINPREK